MNPEIIKVAMQINAPIIIDAVLTKSPVLFLAAQYSLVMELFLYSSNSQFGKLGSIST